MATPSYYRFSLRSGPGSYYYVSGGNVLLSSAKRPLPDGPDGWIEEGINYERSLTMHGMFRRYSEQIRFVTDGATIIRHLAMTKGTEGPLQLEVERRNNNTWEYEPYFIGDVEMRMPEGEDLFVSANTRDGGLTVLLKTNENIEQEIPLGPDALNILHDGVRLKNTSYFIVQANFIDTNTVARQFSPYMDNYLNDGEVVRDVFSRLDLDTDVPNVITRRHFFYRASTNNLVNLHFKGTVRLRDETGIVPGSEASVGFLVTDQDDVGVSYVEIFSDPNWYLTGDETYVIDETTNINMPSGYKITFVVGLQPFGSFTGAGNIQGSVTDGLLTMDYLLRLPSSDVKAYRYITAMDKTVKAFAGPTYGVQSTFLSSNTLLYENRPYSTFVTGGDAVRGLSDTIMKPSFRKLFDSAYAVWGVGAAVEGDNVRVERLSYFYDRNTKIVSLGEVRDLRWRFDQNSLFRLLQIGYNIDQYDKLNAREDWNTIYKYVLPLTTDQEEEWLSDVRADIFGIEEVRGNLSQKKTTDSEADNALFMFSVNPVPSGDNYTLYRPQNNPGCILLGVTDPESAYNIDLAPAYNYRRLLGPIRSSTYFQQGQEVKFQTSDRNQYIISNLGGGTIIHNANIPVTQSVDPLWLPIVFNFTCPVPENYDERMAVAPYGYMDLIWRGSLFKVFVDKGAQINAEKHTYEFEGRLTPDNDLTKLIY